MTLESGLSPSGTTSLAKRVRSMGRAERVRLVTVICGVMGTLWCALESSLRGAFRLTWEPTLVLLFACIGPLLGAAVRPRATRRGEVAVTSEFVWVAAFAVSVLPAVLLLLYAASALVSVSAVGLLWMLWGLGLAVAWVVQAAVYLGLIAAPAAGAGIMENDEARVVGGAIGLIIYVVGVSLVGAGIAGSVASPWDRTVVAWAARWGDGIPEWAFVLNDLRGALATFDHLKLIQLVVSICCGALIGVPGATATRAVRRRLMRSPALRAYLPLAAAPVSDEAALLRPKLLYPVLTYLAAFWTVVAIWSAS